MSRFREGDIMKDFSGIEFASEHNGTDVFRLIELAYEQGRKNGHSEQLGTNLAEVGTDLISRAAAQTELQLSARRYTVAHEAHGEGRVVWSEDLISVSDAMDVLRKIPSAQPTFDARDTQYNLPIGTDLISRQQAIDDIWTVSPLARLDRKWVDRWLRRLPPIQPVNNSENPNSSDVISRQAAIDALNEYFARIGKLKRRGLTKGEKAISLDTVGTIKTLPPAEPKRGRWLYCEDSMADSVDGYRCDQCGFFVPWDYTHKSIDYIKSYKYCPYCGADMRGEQE